MNSLDELLERVKAATGESSYERIGYDVLVALLGRGDAHGWLYHNKRGDPSLSLDSALALVERVLPGWRWKVQSIGFGGANAEVCVPLFPSEPKQPRNRYVPVFLEPVIGCWVEQAATPALAMIAALLSALQAKASAEGTHDGSSPKPQDLSARDQ